MQVISACGKGRLSNKAQRYFEAMAPAKVEANEFTYSSLMTAMERSQEPERALAAFERMQLQGIKPNVYTYTSAISACEKVSVHACLYECRYLGHLRVRRGREVGGGAAVPGADDE